MKTIHKIVLNPTPGISEYEFPADFVHLSIQVQFNYTPILYYLTSDLTGHETKNKIVRIGTVYTGQPIDVPNFPQSGQYLGTAVLGAIVVHFILID